MSDDVRIVDELREEVKRLTRENKELKPPFRSKSTLIKPITGKKQKQYFCQDLETIQAVDLSKGIIEQRRLKQEIEWYKAMSSVVNDMIAIVDTEFTLRAVNDAYCDGYNKEQRELLGCPIEASVYDPEMRTELKGKIRGVFEGRLHFSKGWEKFPDNQERYFHTYYYPMYEDSRGKIVGAIIKKVDRTERKKLESQFLHAQKMEAVGRLAGGIAHDFNNILSVINGYSDLCLALMEDGNICKNHVEKILDSGQRATRLTQQLLAFSRKQIIKPKRVNLGRELDALFHMLDRLLGDSIDIAIQQADDLWDVWLDSTQLEQIVMNLAVNSGDAMDQHGKILIELTNFHCDERCLKDDFELPPGDYVTLTISDTGAGMDEETQKNIFEPFFTTKDISKGTGLGLSTVYGIVKQNNGYITVDSEVELGTTFSLYFPRYGDGAKGEESCEAF